jgi:hypothetical protein
MRLPEQVYIKREPRTALADFFLTADRYAFERGVKLSISDDFDELLSVNRRNLETWMPLFPSVSPEFNDVTQHRAFWLKGVSSDSGEVVLARAARCYDVPRGRSMHDMLVDLSLFYDSPDLARPYEHMVTQLVTPRGITGRFVLSVAGWHHPSVRKLNLSAVAPRVVRAWAYNEWTPSLFTSMVEDHATEKASRAYRMRNQEVGIHWMGGPMHDHMALTLFWMTPEHLLETLSEFVEAQSPLPLKRQSDIAA